MKTWLMAAAWLGVLALPALADSRGVVAERLARCGGLTDTRQYLDCYYAAAQPLRTELGLAPAPQAQGFAPLFAQPGMATPAPRVASVVPAPVPQQQDSGGGLAHGIIAGVMGMRTAKVAPEQFGLKNARPGPGVNVDHITARMTSLTHDRAGQFTVTLDNGQVWQQLPGDEHSPAWRSSQAYVMTVSYGAMGSFNLTASDGDPTAYKVQRVR